MSAHRPRAARRRRGETAGQGMVEFALVAPVFLLSIFGIVDFGVYFSTRNGVMDAARDGARYAAVHPSAWDKSATASSNSIEGAVQHVGFPVIPNNDTAISIKYFNIGASSAVQCGHYSVTAPSPGFVGDNGYTQTTCLVPLSTMIQVDVTYTHVPFTPYPIPLSYVTYTETTRILEEQ